MLLFFLIKTLFFGEIIEKLTAGRMMKIMVM